MADTGVNGQYMLDLKAQVRRLGAAYQTLNNIFVEGTFRLARDADAERLQGLVAGLKHQLEEVILSEDGARTSWERADSIGDAGKLIGEIIGSTPGEHRGIKAFERTLAIRRAGRRQSFGTAMVCVGKGGLPDDIHMISISKLARDQSRKEDEIIRELQDRGERLFPPKIFLDMLEKYVEKAREGKLCLPVSTDQLPAGLAVPRRITVESIVPFRSVPQLPPGRSWVQKKKDNLPNDT